MTGDGARSGVGGAVALAHPATFSGAISVDTAPAPSRTPISLMMTPVSMTPVSVSMLSRSVSISYSVPPIDAQQSTSDGISRSNIVKGEIHNVLSTMRLNGRFARDDRFLREIPVAMEKIYRSALQSAV